MLTTAGYNSWTGLILVVIDQFRYEQSLAEPQLAIMVEYARLPSSGIKTIIVGAGFAGLCAAIECDRKGHNVVLLEKVKNLKPLGDIISFSSNSGRIFERWEGVVEQLDPIIHRSSGLNFHSWEGEFMTRQVWDVEEKYGRRINGHRAEIHAAVLQHALARGIDVRLGQNVTDYFETDDEAGVVSNGERLTADCVFGAEGVKSRGRKIVLGFEDRPKGKRLCCVASLVSCRRVGTQRENEASGERWRHAQRLGKYIVVVPKVELTMQIGEDKHFPRSVHQKRQRD